MLTLQGDAKLDGQVSFSDSLVESQNLGSTSADWAHADFTYDGAVTFSDLLAQAQSNNRTNGNTPLSSEFPASFVALWTLAVEEVEASGTLDIDLNLPANSGNLSVTGERWKRESNRGPARGIVKRMARAEKGATATGRWLG